MKQSINAGGLVGRAESRSTNLRDSSASVLNLLVLVLAVGAAKAQVPVWNGFPAPSKAELAMTSVPGQPGAASVVLWREEIDNDDNSSKSVYERVKVLTEAGKDDAEITIPFTDAYNQGSDDVDLTTTFDVQARTVHADGAIVPFTGKPYIKTIAKSGQVQYREITFEMPDVQVGSIIEYRYVAREPDGVVEPPLWLVQGDRYVMAAHYLWFPTTKAVASVGDGAEAKVATWFPILPAGVEVAKRGLAGGSKAGNSGGPSNYLELSIKDVPPAPKEKMMPPISSFTYRVMFNYSEYRTAQEYWKQKGKDWSKNVNSFAEVNGKLRTATDTVTAGASTPDEKLAKIYAAVEALENTDFTRNHDRREDKKDGLRQIKHVSDVLENKRGNSTQMTELFIAMARAAGFKAYAMLVPNRASDLFIPEWRNIGQFDDMIAIVDVNGKEVFFDPGERYCPYGHLVWQHTAVQGLRQSDGGAEFESTSGEQMTANYTTRVADLTMDEHGVVDGTITLQYTGAKALEWRQRALRGDEESMRGALRQEMEATLPAALDVKVNTIDGLGQYEQPLKITLTVQGPLGTTSGRDIVVPSQLFAARERATFPEVRRELAVYFRYPERVQDAVRITFPPSMKVEATPEGAKDLFQTRGAYQSVVEKTATSIIIRRDYEFATSLVPTKDYADLRAFYGQMESADQEPIVLQLPAAAVVADGTPAARSSTGMTPSNGGV